MPFLNLCLVTNEFQCCAKNFVMVVYKGNFLDNQFWYCDVFTANPWYIGGLKKKLKIKKLRILLRSIIIRKTLRGKFWKCIEKVVFLIQFLSWRARNIEYYWHIISVQYCTIFTENRNMTWELRQYCFTKDLKKLK